MKKGLILIALALFSVLTFAQKQPQDWPNRAKYAASNKTLANISDPNRIIFLGNSITELWVDMHPNFFKENNYTGRGISGQTSPQLLVRFREDVIALHPKTVIINIGTNDIAENTGPYNEDFTFGNIISMVELAQAHHIQVLLASVLPSIGFSWNPSIKDAASKIIALNKRIKEYASSHHITYIDYFSALKDQNNALPSSLSEDGVHPNSQGYLIMEKVVKEALK